MHHCREFLMNLHRFSEELQTNLHTHYNPEGRENVDIFCDKMGVNESKPTCESSIWQSLGNNSGQLANSPLEEIVVMRMPTVARMRGEGSPMAERHSLRMKSATGAGNLWK